MDDLAGPAEGDRLRRRVLDNVARRFDSPLIENSLRAMYVEHLIEELLGDAWDHTGADWGRCDFTSSDTSKIRLEVKQSAALQSWTPEDPAAVIVPNPRFDIRERTGWYDGADWRDEPGRSGEVYVFAWHPHTDRSVADHGDPLQWEFYVVLASTLPATKSIGLTGIEKLGQLASASTLSTVVEAAASAARAARTSSPSH